MPAIIIYLLKVNAALCLFYLAYRFALRPLTFYYLNRFFLVFGIVFSTVYPLVDVAALFAKHTAIRQQLNTIVPNWNAVLPAVQHKVAAVDYWQAPVILFWAGVVLMALRLMVQFISLYRIHHNSEPDARFGKQFRSVKGEVNPFSFWQEIYLNPDKHTDAELRSIIQHEQVHVRQWHTLDVILTELSVVFYWFNPGVWFMKQAVKENLEFITDREILRSGVDEKVYQYSLVRVSALKPSAAIVNNFNFLTIKKRIMMMNKKRSSRANLTRYVVLPLVMLLALVFTISKADSATKNISVLVKRILPATVTTKPSPVMVTPNQNTKRDTVKPKIKRDSLKLAVIQGDQNQTIPDTFKGQRVVKDFDVVRVNGKDLTKSHVIVLNSKGEPVTVNLATVPANQIDSIRVVSRDSTNTIYGYTIKSDTKNNLVVKLKPTANVSTFSVGILNQPMITAVSAGSSSGPTKVFAFRSHNNSPGDLMVYAIDPKNVSTDDIDHMRKEFKNNGFNLDVHENYSGKTLKGLRVKISHEGKNTSSSASSEYTNDDMGKVDYRIRVVADKNTGEVSIMAVK